MNEQNRTQALSESISALVDNQASELELLRILKASEQDASVKATWARYQILGSVLRDEQASYAVKSAYILPNFAERVSAAIAAEEQAPVLQKSQQGLWYQLGRAALVASVAGGMILSVQQFNSALPQGSEMASNSNIAPIAAPALSLPSGINSPAINTRTVALQAGYQARPHIIYQPRQAATDAAISDEEITRYVNQLIQAQSDNAAMNANQGVLPYERVIITEKK